MAASGGYGIRLRIGAPAAEEVIVNVDEIDELQFTKFISESTGHDSTGGYYESVATGKFRIQPFTVGVWWDDTVQGHIDVLAAFDALTDSRFEWRDPASMELIVFQGHVEMIGRVALQEGTYRANITIHPTGQATIT